MRKVLRDVPTALFHWAFAQEGTDRLDVLVEAASDGRWRTAPDVWLKLAGFHLRRGMPGPTDAEQISEALLRNVRDRGLDDHARGALPDLMSFLTHGGTVLVAPWAEFLAERVVPGDAGLVLELLSKVTLASQAIPRETLPLAPEPVKHDETRDLRI